MRQNNGLFRSKLTIGNHVTKNLFFGNNPIFPTVSEDLAKTPHKCAKSWAFFCQISPRVPMQQRFMIFLVKILIFLPCPRIYQKLLIILTNAPTVWIFRQCFVTYSHVTKNHDFSGKNLIFSCLAGGLSKNCSWMRQKIWLFRAFLDPLLEELG